MSYKPSNYKGAYLPQTSDWGIGSPTKRNSNSPRAKLFYAPKSPTTPRTSSTAFSRAESASYDQHEDILSLSSDHMLSHSINFHSDEKEEVRSFGLTDFKQLQSGEINEEKGRMTSTSIIHKAEESYEQSFEERSTIDKYITCPAVIGDKCKDENDTKQYENDKVDEKQCKKIQENIVMEGVMIYQPDCENRTIANTTEYLQGCEAETHIVKQENFHQRECVIEVEIKREQTHEVTKTRAYISKVPLEERIQPQHNCVSNEEEKRAASSEENFIPKKEETHAKQLTAEETNDKIEAVLSKPLELDEGYKKCIKVKKCEDEENIKSQKRGNCCGSQECNLF